MAEAQTEAQRVLTESAQDRERARQEQARERVREREQAVQEQARERVQAVQEQARERVQAVREQEQAAQERTQERERVLAEARLLAQQIVEEALAANANVEHESAPSLRASVSVFFHGEVAAATDGFSAACLFGAGGFGKVYMVPPLRLGGLGSDSMYLAVKKLDGDSMQGQAEFMHAEPSPPQILH